MLERERIGERDRQLYIAECTGMNTAVDVYTYTHLHMFIHTPTYVHTIIIIHIYTNTQI